MRCNTTVRDNDISTFDKGVIKIENCIKLDKRLEELPISSASLQMNIYCHHLIYQMTVIIFMSLNYIMLNNCHSSRQETF